MTRSALGKRTRGVTDPEPASVPVKRPRRAAAVAAAAATAAAAAALANDENVAPADGDYSGDEADEDEDESDAELVATARTPSRRLHSVGRGGEFPLMPSTPRRLFASASKSGSVPTTPRMPQTPRTWAHSPLSQLPQSSKSSPLGTPNIYHLGRRLFARCADPGTLVGREAERQQVDAFLARLASSRPGGCLYVSGPPGTGKSALVQQAVRDTAQAKTKRTLRHIYVNCMSIKSAADLFKSLTDELAPETDAESRKGGGIGPAERLQRIFVDATERQPAVSYLVVLDEIDHVVTLGQNSLYRLFEWSLHKGSRLALIGIANALNLTDKHLPRLKARNVKPELLPFLPYSAVQVRNIITTRLRTLAVGSGSGQTDNREGRGAETTDDGERADDGSFVPLIHPAAIELCARKVAGQTGDLRPAFEICRRVLDLVEQQTRLQLEAEAREKMLLATPSRRPLGERVNWAWANVAGNGVGGPARGPAQAVASSLAALTVETAPRATIAHLGRVTAAVFGNGTSQRLKTLNLQQKAALCALVAYERRNRAAASAAAASTASPIATANMAMATTAAATPPATPTTRTPSKVRVATTTTTPKTPRTSKTPVSARSGKAGRMAAAATAPTARWLYEAYVRLCRCDAALHPLAASEFADVLGGLESLGLVRALGSGAGAGPASLSASSGRGSSSSADDRRVASCVAEAEVEAVAEGAGAGVGILRSILAGQALD